MKHLPNTAAVIGAGIAGLAAARALRDAGLAVQVFERGRGVGGRTAHRATGDHHFDHGAQYFTVHDARFAAQVAAWTEAGTVAPWSGRIVALGDAPAPSPTAAVTRHVGVPGMNAMARHLAGGLDVTTGCTVARIEHAGEGWHLRIDAGASRGPYDALVLAMPPEQAARIAPPGGVPDLPAGTGSQPCWCALAAFDQPLAVDFDGAFVNGTALDWVARDSSKPGRPAGERWVMHATPAWSAGRLAEPADDVARALLGHFFEALGIPAEDCTHLAGHRWSLARPTREIQVECLWQAAPPLALCGDWCSGGRVEGAYLSGLAAAARVAASVAHQGMT